MGGLILFNDIIENLFLFFITFDEIMKLIYKKKLSKMIFKNILNMVGLIVVFVIENPFVIIIGGLTKATAPLL